MTVLEAHQLLKQAQIRLNAQEVEGARGASEAVLEKVLGQPKIEWILERQPLLPEKKVQQFWSLIERCLKHEPLQYVLEEAHFLDWAFRVSRDCLIPRPETEQLVEKIVQELAKTSPTPISILDLGTGSGNIIISLALKLKRAHLVASDRSKKALNVARINAKHLGVTDRIDFRWGENFEIVKNETFDVIVSNPPYLSEEEWRHVSEEVQQEPKEALVAGPTGLECLEKIIAHAQSYLKPEGLLALEIGSTQAQRIQDRLKQLHYHSIHVFVDLAGLDRMVMARNAA